VRTWPAVLLLLSASSVFGWNKDGHMAVAYIAYQHLSPAARTQVDAILKTHPDYDAWVKEMPEGSDHGLEAFLHSSYWPDTLRSDPRVWDEAAREPHETPILPGFPDMKMHKNWHYTNVPYITSGQIAAQAEIPNVQTSIDAILKEPMSGYNLSWLVHLVGDVHQPLHCVSRFSGRHLDEITKKDRSDLGGNLFVLDDPAKNLHKLWDDALPAAEVRTGLPASADMVVHLDTNSWVQESAELARSVVYSLGPDSPDSPAPTVPADYRQAMQKIARERIGLAGYRLAAILNQRLQ
jgi:hypothetical protein